MGNYLGQHFLKNQIKLRKIVEALDIKNNEVIVEIGPGKGALTDEIIAKLQDLKIEKFKFIAIEKDENLAEFLKEKYEGGKNMEIIKGDALKVLPKIISNLSIFQSCNYKLVGNIPYYITGHLFRILSELENKPLKIVLMVQKEVAQRICAPKYGQKMNLLALATQFYADVKILFYVSRGDFQPAPKVDSAVIEITPRRAAISSADKELFFKIIKAGFSQKRKLLAANLAKNLKIPRGKIEEIFKQADIGLKSRAEDLSMIDWMKIKNPLRFDAAQGI